MGYLKIKLPDSVEESFRKAAMRRFGYQKGAISKAAQEALEKWATQHLKIEEETGDPIEAIAGIIKHTKKTSVELQHEAWKPIEENAHRR